MTSLSSSRRSFEKIAGGVAGGGEEKHDASRDFLSVRRINPVASVRSTVTNKMALMRESRDKMRPGTARAD